MIVLNVFSQEMLAISMKLRSDSQIGFTQACCSKYILVGGLKVTYSYQVLKNGLEDVTNDVRDCPGGGPCYVLVYVGLEAGLVTQSEDSLFCPQQKWTFHLFLHFDSADF